MEAAKTHPQGQRRARAPRRGDGLRQRGRRWARSGFTLIEVMLAVLILVIGLVGVVAMQIVAIQANSSARDLTEATNIAEHFVNLLQQDGSRWTPSAGVANTTYLAVIADAPDVWQPVGAEPFNVLGVPQSGLPAKGQGRAKFCVAYKLHWGVTDAVITGFVRVFWSRIPGSGRLAACGTDGALTLDGLDTPAGSVGVAMVTLPLSVQRAPVD